jgi:N utilization substance protein B
VEFRNVASTIKSNFGTSPQNFVKNLLIRKIEYDKSIKGAILAAGVSWTPQKEKVREWYRDIVRKDSQFEEYLKLDKTDFFVDKGLADHLLRDIILKNQAIGAFFEEEDLRWSEHEAVVKGMIKKSMKEIAEEKEFPQFSISMDWEEDKEFFEVLFDRVIEEERNIEALIGRKVKNWELDRLALIDKIILSLAVAELKNFPNIPVKVTINEYIEVSKRYSTPKSKEFINGVLDGITQELKSQGLIKKSGRGLLDNK